MEGNLELCCCVVVLIIVLLLGRIFQLGCLYILLFPLFQPPHGYLLCSRNMICPKLVLKFCSAELGVFLDVIWQYTDKLGIRM